MSDKFNDPLKGFRSTLRALEAIGGQSSLRELAATIEKQSSVTRLANKQMVQQQALYRMIEGPLADLKRLDAIAKIGHDASGLRTIAEQIDSRFKLPDMSESTRLFKEFRASPAFEILREHQLKMASIEEAAKKIQTPWLNIQDSLRSVTGFTRLQVLGSSVRGIHPYGENIASTIRSQLGDWRDVITWPREIFTDYQARADFYLERGFDPDLTDFPSDAFDESMEIAGLLRSPPAIVEEYGEPVPSSTDGDVEDGFARTNRAHDWLNRIEQQIRKFIDVLMTKQYGSEWAKHRLPNGMYDRWHDKQKKARASGRGEYSLVCYADFTEYELVICRADNWKEVFSGFFQRPEFVRETFQRLYPVRIDTMHARLITQDDELFLYAEIRRLMMVIGSADE